MSEQAKRAPMESRRPTTRPSRAEVIQALEAILAPQIGAHMARASVRAHCRRLGGEDEDEIRREQIESLIGQLRLGLAVLVGRERAEEVTRAMRNALLDGGAP